MGDEGYVNYTREGENVACGKADAKTIFQMWATSPLHLANMVNPHFHHMGIARAGTGNEKCPYYWTNDMGSISDPKLDPADITDVNAIAQAVFKVSGELAPMLREKGIQLPPPAPGTQAPVATPAPAPVPIEIEPADETPSAPSPTEASVIQCTIPYAMGKGLLTSFQNTDTILEATKSTTGNGYTLKLSYLQNGQNTTLIPLYVYNASVVKNPYFPLYTIFAAANSRVNGFSIQFNTQTNQAQFEPYNAGSGGNSGTILCSMKF